MKTVWLLWENHVKRSGLVGKRLLGVFASYAAALCATSGVSDYEIEEVRVRE
jgi:hypothetical protein